MPKDVGATMLDYATARRNMVDCQLRTFDVTDRAILAAMDEVPRELFMPAGSSELAYLDRSVGLAAVPGGDDRVMLSPMVLARLLQALDIEADSRVLDVGCGLGYASALLVRLGARVTALEVDDGLAVVCRDRLSAAGCADAVEVRTGSLAGGAPDRAPFDAIIVNGAVEETPSVLLDQLVEGGRLACLSAGAGPGRATLYVRAAGRGIGSRVLFDAVAPTLAEFRTPHAFRF